MSFYKKKPVIIEAITFDELIAYGISINAPTVGGKPCRFRYKGHPITQLSDTEYLIPTLEGEMKFTNGDMLITGVNGEIYPCKLDIFNKTYEAVDK